MKILIVEDNNQLNYALKEGLQNDGFVVDVSYDGKNGLFKARVNDYDLIVLDLNLPEIDGIKLAKNLRCKNINIPIIALTARDKVESKLHGFEVGFDDYMTKPFEYAELVARIKAIIRRSKPERDVHLKLKDIVMDPRSRTVKRSGHKIVLTKTEFNIFEYLLRKKGLVVSYAEIVEHIWGEDSDLLDPPIRSHIKNLRNKLGDDGLDLIKTKPGIGYKI